MPPSSAPRSEVRPSEGVVQSISCAVGERVERASNVLKFSGLNKNQGAIVKAKGLLVACALAMGLMACSSGGDGGGDVAGGSKTVSGPDVKTIGTGVLMPRTFVFSEQEAKGSTISETEFEVRRPQMRVYEIGDVLIVDDHGGRLIKITGVQIKEDGIVYSYEQASLAEAFETLDVRMQGDLTRDDLGDSFDMGDPEIELRWASNVSTRSLSSKAIEVDDNVLELNFNQLGVQSKSSIEINGGASFKLNPDFGIKLERQAGGYLPDLSFSAMLSPDFKGYINLTSRYGGSVSYSRGWEKEMKPIRRFIVVPGLSAPVPFWVTPKLNGSVAVSGFANSKFYKNYSFGVDGRFGVRKPAQGNWDLVADISGSAALEVSDVQGELGIGFQAPNVGLSFLIYSVGGPNFDIKFIGDLAGSGATRSGPYQEGVQVEGKVRTEMHAGLKGGVDLDGVGALKKLWGGVSFSYAPISLKVYEGLKLVEYERFFPYKGKAAITVFDSGSSPDDVFEVNLDGRVVGRTSKGGSGQFRLSNLRPGEHSLTVSTVEDDEPPGTWGVRLGEGVTFTDGATSDSGYSQLGGLVSFIIIAPEEQE